MHTGMLWFDNSQTRLEIKLQKAAEYYEKKPGRSLAGNWKEVMCPDK